MPDVVILYFEELITLGTYLLGLVLENGFSKSFLNLSAQAPRFSDIQDLAVRKT